MLQYILRRLVQFIPVFFGVTLLLFFLTTLLPGRPGRAAAPARRSSTRRSTRQMRHEYGLDKPWYVQYVDYLGRLAHGDLGTSISNGPPGHATSSRETYPEHDQARARRDRSSRSSSASARASSRR